jgi:hypothetical protein
MAKDAHGGIGRNFDRMNRINRMDDGLSDDDECPYL